MGIAKAIANDRVGVQSKALGAVALLVPFGGLYASYTEKFGVECPLSC